MTTIQYKWPPEFAQFCRDEISHRIECVSDSLDSMMSIPEAELGGYDRDDLVKLKAAMGQLEQLEKLSLEGSSLEDMRSFLKHNRDAHYEMTSPLEIMQSNLICESDAEWELWKDRYNALRHMLGKKPVKRKPQR